MGGFLWVGFSVMVPNMLCGVAGAGAGAAAAALDGVEGTTALDSTSPRPDGLTGGIGGVNTSPPPGL